MLTLRDKIALIYTSAGSQRKVASLIGISHQKVGRILMESYAPTSRVLKDSGLRLAIDLAFSIHKDVTRYTARKHHLPYDARFPVFIERKPLKTGQLGDRVVALHTHWLSNEIRNAWIAAMHQSGKFAAASVGSIVNLIVYSKRAEADNGKLYRDERKERDQQSIENRILADMKEAGVTIPNFDLEKDRRQITNWLKGHSLQQQVVQGMIYTKYTPMDPRFRTADVLRDMNSKLQTKHAPAVGDPGTIFANSVLLQVDTRNAKDKEFRDAHPWTTKPAKAKRNKKQAGARPRNRKA